MATEVPKAGVSRVAARREGISSGGGASVASKTQEELWRTKRSTLPSGKSTGGDAEEIRAPGAPTASRSSSRATEVPNPSFGKGEISRVSCRHPSPARRER